LLPLLPKCEAVVERKPTGCGGGGAGWADGILVENGGAIDGAPSPRPLAGPPG